MSRFYQTKLLLLLLFVTSRVFLLLLLPPPLLLIILLVRFLTTLTEKKTFIKCDVIAYIENEIFHRFLCEKEKKENDLQKRTFTI